MNCTTKTAANILTPLRAIIDQALVDQYIKENPLNSIIVDKLLNKETKKSDYKPDPLSVDEINTILSAAEGQVRLLFQFAFFTGMRISELIGLRWEDIDWKNQVVHVEEKVVAKEVKGPKTEAGVRDILLLPPAIEALEQQKQYTLSFRGRVFHNPQTNKPWETSQQVRRTQWMHILKKTNVRGDGDKDLWSMDTGSISTIGVSSCSRLEPSFRMNSAAMVPHFGSLINCTC